MIPGQFDYVRPQSLDEALRILKDREGEAKVLSGRLQPAADDQAPARAAGAARRHPGRRRASTGSCAPTTTGGSAPGPRTARSSSTTGSPPSYPIIRDAAGGIGDPQVRNWGTIGGSVAHADPSSDWPAVLLGAARRRSSCGAPTGSASSRPGASSSTRSRPAIEPTEVLTEVRIPHAAPRTGSAYVKLERRAGDFATVGVAAVLTLGRRRPDLERRRRPHRGRRRAVRGDRGRGRPRRAGSRATSVRAAAAAAAATQAGPSPTATARPTTSGRWSAR